MTNVYDLARLCRPPYFRYPDYYAELHEEYVAGCLCRGDQQDLHRLSKHGIEMECIDSDIIHNRETLEFQMLHIEGV